jgi:ABC-type uncharacterized transport system substrate-binding protein
MRLGITNLNRPGGQVTGLSNLVDVLFVKRLEFLKEMLPQARRIAVLRDPVNEDAWARAAQLRRA